jgi:hypothetical protein
MLPGHFTFKTVGVSFADDYPDNLTRLRESWERHYLTTGEEPEGLAAVLVRRPDNKHDPNAIEVHVPAVGMVGQVPAKGANLAAKLSAELDAGVRWTAEVEDVLIHPDHPDRPGITVKVGRAPDEG